jgi:hypothetical protein
MCRAFLRRWERPFFHVVICREHRCADRKARAITNGIGNGVATIVVGKWYKEVDEDRMRRHLDQETELEADEPQLVLDQKEEHMVLSDSKKA